MTSNNLIDLGFQGYIFKWEMTFGDSNTVTERLDRALANPYYFEKWPKSYTTVGTRIESNHCPLVLDCNPNIQKGGKVFRFEAKCFEMPDCEYVIKWC